MRIWFVNQYAIPPQEPGGTRHHALAARLAARGHDTAVIASSFSHVLRIDRHLDGGENSRLEMIDGVEWVWLRSPSYAGNSLGRAWNMVVFGYRVWRDPLLHSLPAPDVIIGSTPPLPAAYGAMKLAQTLECGFVGEVRDLWPRALEELGGYGRRHPMIWVLRAMEQSIYSASSRLITLLPSSQGYLIDQGVPREKIVWMPNGVEMDRVPAAEPLIEKKDFTVMYAGTHGFANGLDLVLDAASELGEEDIRFRLIGDGPDKDRLIRRAKAEGISNVTFEDAVPKARIYGVLAQASAFILPLQRANVFAFGLSPNKLFDYLAAGRPLILAADGDLGDVPVDEVGVVASPTGPSIANAVRVLHALPHAKRAEMGAAARSYVETHPDIADVAVELEALLSAQLDA